MSGQLASVLVGTAGLSVAVVVAFWLTLARHGIAHDNTLLRSAVRASAAALPLQAAHFAEELTTGFDEAFPRLLGLSSWPSGFFPSFNIFWLAVWTVSILGLRARRRAALFPLWFLGLACVVNGLAHPALAVMSGAYFPGLVTAPLVGLAGALLLRRLSQLTA